MSQNTRDYTRLRNRISLVAVIIAAVIELIAILVKGVRLDFTYGLALGTAISIVNFHVMAFFIKRSYEKGGAVGTSFAGYLVRLVLYAAAVLVSAKTSNASLLGTILGFLTIQIGIYVDSFIGRKGSWN